jgi:hypothetical protein
MRALLRKEAIALMPYALPLLAGYALLYWLELRNTDIRNVAEPVQRFIWFPLVTLIVGGLVGFAQAVPARDPDAWAFAVHRPIARRRLFLCRVLAGQSMMLLVAGGTYAMAMWWLSVPGHAAVPFYWRMALPGIVTLLSGFIGQAAGLQIGATRRVLPRALAVIAAMAGPIAIAVVDNFWGAMAVGAAIGALLLLGAGASFVTGDDESRSAPAKVAIAASLVPGCLAIYAVISIAAGGMDAKEMDGGVRPDSVVAFVTYDGRLARGVVFDTVRDVARETFARSVTDIAGRKLADPGQVYAREPISTGVLTAANANVQHWQGEPGYRNPSRWAQRLLAGHDGPIWYFEKRHGLISVYDAGTLRRTGWIGPDGFSAGGSMPARRYEGGLIYDFRGFPDHLVLTSAVYALHYPEAPTHVYTAPAGDTVISVVRPTYSGDPWPGALSILARGGPARIGSFTAVISTQAVTLLDDSGRVELRSPHPEGASPRRVIVARAPLAGSRTYIWYAPDGDSLNRVLEYRAGNSVPVARRSFTGTVFEPGFSGMARRAPAGGADQSRSRLASANMSPAVSVTLIAMGKLTPGAARWSLALGFVWAIGGWMIGLRGGIGSTARGFWSAAALAGGPLVLLMEWVTLGQPARERCPACGNIRLAGAEQCTHCAAGAERLALTGIEIVAV